MSNEFIAPYLMVVISVGLLIFNIWFIITNNHIQKIIDKLNRIEEDFMDRIVVRIDSIHAKVSVLESILTIKEREIREKVSDIMIDEIKRIKKG